jgi:hypothetical protein
MQFHNHQQPRFITLGDRLVDIYGIVDILPFQVETPNRRLLLFVIKLI